MHVVLDPGHGGSDPGATGYGLKEKDVVLDVALRAERHIARHGIKVTLTRRGDETLPPSSRVDRVNRAGGDALVSIHCNGSENPSARGTETYHSIFSKPGQGGHRLAHCIHPLVVLALGTQDRGVKTKRGSSGRDYYYIIRETKPPAVLLELAFITNPEDNRKLDHHREDIAVAIAKGVIAFFGLAWKDSAPLSSAKSGPYSDVPADFWAAQDIREVRDAGIMIGYSDGTFKPDRPVTRDELAVVANRLRKLLKG